MRNRAIAVFCLMLLCWSLGAFGQTRPLDIYFVDVEGGAATLIVTPAGESMLIDCGSPGARDAQRIHQVATQAAGLKAIDHLILTHWHSDHFGGTADLAKLLPIKRVYHRGITPALKDEPARYPQMLRDFQAAVKGKDRALKAGDLVPVLQKAGQPTVRLLTLCGSKRFIADKPNAAKNVLAEEHLPQDPDPSDNAQSLGFLLSFGGFRFLDLGDLTWNMERELVAPTNKIGEIDVYLTTHHGLEYSNNPVLIKSVNPRVAIFNNGPRKGGHPDVVHTLRDLPEMQAIYQLHRNMTSLPGDNEAASRIANWEENCKGEFILLRVAPDARSYSVRIGRNGKSQTFTTRLSR